MKRLRYRLIILVEISRDIETLKDLIQLSTRLSRRDVAFILHSQAATRNCRLTAMLDKEWS